MERRKNKNAKTRTNTIIMVERICPELLGNKWGQGWEVIDCIILVTVRVCKFSGKDHPDDNPKG